MGGLVSLCAQESAVNYIIPKVSSIKTLCPSQVKSISSDITNISVDYLDQTKVKYQSIIEKDGSLTYKIIYFKNIGANHVEDYAYFISFIGNKAILKGFSKYNVEKGASDYKVIGEKYTSITTNQAYYQVPSESYQTTEWTYNDPNSDKSIKARGFYKTMAFNGKDERIFIVEHEESGTYLNKIRTEYFLKNFGLIAIQANQNDKIYITDLVPYKLFSDTYIESLGEEQSRKFGWDMIQSIRTEMDIDDELGEDDFAKLETMDSLVGLYEHLMIKYPAKENLYRYILSLIYNNWADYYYFGVSKEDLKKSTIHENIMDNLNSFYLMRLSPDYIPKSDLRGYVTRIDEDYHDIYWYNLFVKFSTMQNFNIKIDYYVYLFANDVSLVENNDASILGENLFFLHSYLATYYT